MKNTIRRTLALALTLAMLLTAFPVEALASIRTVSKSVSTGALMAPRAVTPDDVSYKITFVLDGEQKTEWTQIVTADSPSARQPDAPVKDHMRFLGWFDAAEGGSCFNEWDDAFQALSSDVTLYSRYETVYYLSFADDTGRIFYTMTYGEKGIDCSDFSEAEAHYGTKNNQAIISWYADSEHMSPISSVKADNDTTIYAAVGAGAWLRFETNGGSRVESAFYLSNQVTKQPANPIRNGYKFEGWYTSPAFSKGTGFTFGRKLSTSTTLYAKWTAQDVTYQIAYWLENANDDNYTLDYIDGTDGRRSRTALTRRRI